MTFGCDFWLELGNGIGVWDRDWRLRIGDRDWELGILEFGIVIGDSDWRLGIGDLN